MLELSFPSQSKGCETGKRLLTLYHKALENADPIWWKVLSDPLLKVKTDPFVIVPGCRDREDLFSLRTALIGIIAR